MPIKNLSDIRRVFTLNIGTVVFGILFIYIIISIILYITSSHVRSYQVTAGPLAKNQIYTGLAMYSEQVIKSDTAGYVDYYAQENSKVRKGGPVYGISSSKDKSAKVTLSGNSLQTVRDSMQSFTLNFDPGNFHSVYSLKYSVDGAFLNQSLANQETAGNGKSSDGTYYYANQAVSTAETDGVVVYATDGYENFNLKNLTPEALDEKSYHLESLKTNKQIRAGDNVYKLITSQNWSLIIPLTPSEAIHLEDKTSVRVKFLKDGVAQNASWSIIKKSGNTRYGKLEFTSGLTRYLDSRFISIELVTNTEVGLKIPVSAVVSKTFYTIPEEFATVGGDSQVAGFLKASTDKNGKITTTFVSTTLYEHKNHKYYVDDTDFHSGDIIVAAEGSASNRYIIGDTDTLEGVYSMNKGYAQFRKISIIDKNENYCIVKKGIDYGIAEFDNIVLDASKVKESQITAASK